MKSITLQINLIPARLRVSPPIRRVARPDISKAGLFLALAMVGLIAGGIFIGTALPGGNGGDAFATWAKTLSTARCQMARVPAWVTRIPPGPWAFNCR